MLSEETTRFNNQTELEYGVRGEVREALPNQGIPLNFRILLMRIETFRLKSRTLLASINYLVCRAHYFWY